MEFQKYKNKGYKAEEVNLPPKTLWRRIMVSKWPIEIALTTSILKLRRKLAKNIIK